ncbi:MAG: PDZ domain-containing protein [Planctomycetes bacterium]|nr:PDZ domain-containing protein [Planctomycetota bacterium]NOG55286.1 PDZ domain-containing protein [Planctomycetota bacterium]
MNQIQTKMKAVTSSAVGAAVVLCASVMTCSSAIAQAPAATADKAAIANAIAPSSAIVEYTVQYVNGEAPGEIGKGYYYYGDAEGYEFSSDCSDAIYEERPVEAAAYLLSPDLVITRDPQLHPRFISSIEVVYQGQRRTASPDSYFMNQDAWLLRVDEPFADAVPLHFDADKPGPYFQVNHSLHDVHWGFTVAGVSDDLRIEPDGTVESSVASGALVVDAHGVPVGLSMTGRCPNDGTWKGSPLDWPAMSADEMDDALQRIEQAADQWIVRINLQFRSPRSGESDMFDPWSYMDSGDSDMTEWDGSGVLIDENTVLITANLKPKVTARLESIRVHFADGSSTAATFAGTLKDYGAMLATLETPASGTPADLYVEPSTQLQDQLLLKAEVRISGESRTVYYMRGRILSYSVGWQRMILPSVSSSSGWSYGGYQARSLDFRFTLDGKLVGLPLVRRPKVTVEDERGSWSMLIPGQYMTDLFADRLAHLDPENRPLSEEEELRLAWLGVELQPMDEDLARVHEVVDETSRGETGAIVTYVYPNSPASEAGIEMGDILLRLKVEGQPKPLEVELYSYNDYGDMFDLWSMMDEIPVEYFSEIPQPWGSVENNLTRSLTDIGFGTPFTADIVRGGEAIERDFIVTEGPAYYNSAPKFKSEGAGLTVRDLTYEVRRYFQIQADEPGVIVSKVEEGGKAAIAGIKPYELIIAINGEPVHSADALKAAIEPGGEFRIRVRRMTKGRIVKIVLDPAESP